MFEAGPLTISTFQVSVIGEKGPAVLGFADKVTCTSVVSSGVQVGLGGGLGLGGEGGFFGGSGFFGMSILGGLAKLMLVKRRLLEICFNRLRASFSSSVMLCTSLLVKISWPCAVP